MVPEAVVVADAVVEADAVVVVVAAPVVVGTVVVRKPVTPAMEFRAWLDRVVPVASSRVLWASLKASSTLEAASSREVSTELRVVISSVVQEMEEPTMSTPILRTMELEGKSRAIAITEMMMFEND